MYRSRSAAELYTIEPACRRASLQYSGGRSVEADIRCLDSPPLARASRFASRPARSCHGAQKLVDIDRRESREGISRAVRQEQRSAERKCPAAIDDVGNIVVAGVCAQADRRLGRPSDQLGGILLIKQACTRAVIADRPDAVKNAQLSLVDLDRRTRIADPTNPRDQRARLLNKSWAGRKVVSTGSTISDSLAMRAMPRQAGRRPKRRRWNARRRFPILR